MSTLRALVVEDDPSLARLIARLLARVSIASVSVEGVTAAEGALAEGDFDVLIVDASLDDGDGVELIADLRARGVRTPAVLVSGSTMPSPDPLTRFLAKPFTKDSLPALVLSLVDPS